jgi:hypothetical protein
MRTSGRVWGHGNQEFLGPVKWHRASAKKPPPTCPSNGSACINNHYVQGRLNHRCIGSFMYKSPRVTLTGCKGVS